MKKVTLLGGLMAVAMSSAPVMAGDFYALSVLQATPAPMQDSELATTEGGAYCDSTGGSNSAVNGGMPGGGVSLCGDLGSGIPASFAVSNELPVTGANFLQVTGGS
jgi:hypothetical protein